MKILVLEGPDGAGKTTLANQLVAQDPLRKVVHNGPPKPNENLFETYTNQILAASRGSIPVIFDRLHFGELVYGQVIRKKSLIGYEGISALTRLIRAAGGDLVLCLPPYVLAKDNWKKRAAKNVEYVLKDQDYHRIYTAYKNLIKYDHPRIYNYLVHEFKEPFGEERNYIPDVVGTRHARWLLVGDQTSRGKIPFHDKQGCSAFLTKCLYRAGFNPWALAFVNARTPEGNITGLNRVIESLPRHARTISLGSVANNICDQQHLVHQNLPHPQYIKRFRASEVNDYIRRFKSIRRAGC